MLLSKIPIQQVMFLLLLLFAFCLPLSTSAISVLACLVVVCWIIEGNYKRKVAEIWANPVCRAVIAYVALMIIALLWSEDLKAGISFIVKQWKIMLMPLFMTAIMYEKRKWYFWAFVTGMTVAMTMTFLAWFGLLQYGDVTTEHITRKTFHVVYNPLLAFAVYGLAHELLWGSLEKKWKVAVGFLIAVMVCNMFITEGRTGQLVFFVLLGLLLLQYFRKNLLAAVAVISLFLPLTFATGYHFSPQFQNRVELAKAEIQQFEQNPNTSVGLRLLYWKNSIEIIKEHPWLGVGTGDFESKYSEVNTRLSPDSKPTDNPHNQYFLVGTRFGIVGLIIVLSVFVMQIREGVIRQDGLRNVRFAFPIFFLVIMLTESYLVVYETGFLFSLFSAVLYKRPPGNDLIESTG